jgi:hypothetical protein
MKARGSSRGQLVNLLPVLTRTGGIAENFPCFIDDADLLLTFGIDCCQSVWVDFGEHPINLVNVSEKQELFEFLKLLRLFSR